MLHKKIPVPFAALLALTFSLIMGQVSFAATVDSEVMVQPKVIKISSFFSGVQMNITSDLPPGCQAVLRVRGKRIEEEMMRKSHHWDLWMNSGEVDMYNVPLLYVALSTDRNLLTTASDYPWGYDVLEKHAKFVGRLKPVEDETIFDEFVQLKERDNLYHLYPGGLKISGSNSGRSKVEAQFHLPSRIKPGSYHVALWVIRDGKVLEKRTASFDVKREGLPAIMNNMAKNHGVSYGFLAVGLAVAVGMLTGIVFQRKSGGH